MENGNPTRILEREGEEGRGAGVIEDERVLGPRALESRPGADGGRR